MMAKKVATWRGRPISEMTKEELLIVVTELACMIDHEREEHTKQLHALRELRVKKGLFGRVFGGVV
jgi:hypothetical protein